MTYAEGGVTKTTSVSVTVAAPLSSDSSLATLLADPAVTAYTATVANSVASVTVQATAADSAATLTGTGTHALAVGANSLQVIVTAANGTTTTYTLTITRQAPPPVPPVPPAPPAAPAAAPAIIVSTGGLPATGDPGLIALCAALLTVGLVVGALALRPRWLK